MAAALLRHCGLGSDGVTTLAPGQGLDVGAVRLQAFAGVHWLTGAEGDEAARKLDRPDRYGVFPAGGPSLGFLAEAGRDRAYLSGDTTLAGVPDIAAPVAIVNAGTHMRNPATKEVDTPVVTGDDLPQVALRLKAQVLVPLHWDYPLFMEPFDLDAARRRMAAECPTCRLVVPAYKEWTELSAG